MDLMQEFWLKKTLSLHSSDCQGGKGIVENHRLALKFSTREWQLFLLISQVAWPCLPCKGTGKHSPPSCTEEEK